MRITVFLLIAIISFKAYSQGTEIIAGIDYNMPSNEATNIIKSLDNPFIATIGSKPFKLVGIMKHKGLTKVVRFIPDESLGESITNDVILNKKLSKDDLRTELDTFKTKLLKRDYSVIQDNSISAIYGSYCILQKENKIIGLMYSNDYTNNSYDYFLLFTNDEILNDEKAFFKMFRTKISNPNNDANYQF